ncbi:MAG: response regulator [Candidatus Brocadiales bacterium]|nr:response regulator [Candidatus Brocadiales bacterium]
MSNKKTILIAEDYALTRAFLKAIFVSDMYFVLEASDGQEAYELVKNNKVDLIVTDIEMPVMDGIELLKLLKKEGRAMPSIVITGKDNVTIKDFIELGVLECIPKPFNKDQILDLLANIFSKE